MSTFYNSFNGRGVRRYIALIGVVLSCPPLVRNGASKTVVAIAHRLSTIAAMDRLIVLDQGRIIEQGEHEALLKRGGLYAKLWAHQSGGFLGDTTDAVAAMAANH